MRLFLIIFFVLFSVFAGISQEVLTGLQVNPMVREKAMEISRTDYLNGGSDTIPVTIPFFDDFSANKIFPSPDRWIDHFGFENDDMPVYPINRGAMTLDALNDSGNMYQTAVPGPTTFIADHLTSRFIRLDSVFTPVSRALSPSDSLFFSFYYQPQGRGKAPQKNDSLVLEFLVAPAHDSLITGGTIPVPDLWRKMWFANGMPLDTFYQNHNKWFVRVMIPVIDPVFFKKKFRFRFYNYVSLASSAEPSWQSNTDQWNLDNVYLNSGRGVYDTVYPELRFIYRPPSFLAKYESMPYPQYCDDPTNEIRDTLDILMTNRDLTAHMSAYSYQVNSSGGSFLKTYNGGSYNIQPYSVVPYVTYQKFAHPEVPFLLPISQTDSATFMVKHMLTATTPGAMMGDTMTALQKFYNYYAYDDGTPEASYGLTPAGSKLAYRFRLNKSPDTLRAIRMFFNRTLSTVSQQFFYLCIWNDNAGKPGDTVYSDLVMPRYADSLNKFVTYHIYPPLAITGTFYVGWIQTTGDNLSIGFDRYNNSQNEIFNSTTGVWNNSAFAGSLMIRPVIGKPIPLGIGDIPASDLKITVYPNPCNTGTLRILIPGSVEKSRISGCGTITISDMIGHTRVKTAFRNEVDVTALAPGLYFMEISDCSGIRIGVSKFIISR
ncbi:MAG: T9SS type A sorting domain-containing protein [bacterium]